MEPGFQLHLDEPGNELGVGAVGGDGLGDGLLCSIDELCARPRGWRLSGHFGVDRA